MRSHDSIVKEAVLQRSAWVSNSYSHNVINTISCWRVPQLMWCLIISRCSGRWLGSERGPRAGVWGCGRQINLFSAKLLTFILMSIRLITFGEEIFLFQKCDFDPCFIAASKKKFFYIYEAEGLDFGESMMETGGGNGRRKEENGMGNASEKLWIHYINPTRDYNGHHLFFFFSSRFCYHVHIYNSSIIVIIIIMLIITSSLFIITIISGVFEHFCHDENAFDVHFLAVLLTQILSIRSARTFLRDLIYQILRFCEFFFLIFFSKKLCNCFYWI